MLPERASPEGNIFQEGFKGSLIITIYWENKMRAPEMVPEASAACEGVDCPSHCALYHGLISEGNICVCIHEPRAGPNLEQVEDSGESATPSSINVVAAMFAHLCNFQITSSLK